MKRTSIYLDEEQDRLLRHLAIEQGQSFTDLVRQALDQYLERRLASRDSRLTIPRRGASKEEWRASFEEALERFRANIDPMWTPEQIEADISAAREEVRRERAARRRAARA